MNFYATKSQRALEAIIDYGLYIPIHFAYVMTFGEPDNEGSYSVHGLLALPLFVYWLFYFPVLESITGQTLGKKIAKVKLTNLSGSNPSFGQALVRRLFDIVDLMFFGLVAVLVINSNEKRQRVGDLVAKTIVIRKNTAQCSSCGIEVEVDKREIARRAFTCPECNTENNI